MPIRSVTVINRFDSRVLRAARAQLRDAAKWGAEEGEKLIRERLAQGTPPAYSSRPSYYRVDIPRGRKSRFIPHVRSQGRKISPAALRSVYMERGYGQWKTIFTGRNVEGKPADFQLTGQFLNNLRVNNRANQRAGEARIWIGFRRKSRSYGKKTNPELMEILNARYGNPIAFNEDEQDTLIAGMTKRIENGIGLPKLNQTRGNARSGSGSAIAGSRNGRGGR